MTLRAQVWTVLRFRGSVAHHSGLQRVSYMFELFVLSVILLNVAIAMYESSVIAPWKDLILYASTTVFSVEYGLRVWSCVEDSRFTDPCIGRLKWMARPMSVIDLFALLPFYLEIVFQIIPSWHGALTIRGLRLLRILVFLRLERSYHALKNLRTIFAEKTHELWVVSYLTAVIVLVSSTTILFLENGAQPEVFSSIGICTWWAIETITSLGYGDIVPITTAGRAFSSVLALWGILLFTIPGAVLSSGFVEVMLKRQEEERRALEESLRVSFSREPYSASSAVSYSGVGMSCSCCFFNNNVSSNLYEHGRDRLDAQLKQQQQQLQSLLQLFSSFSGSSGASPCPAPRPRCPPHTR
ncbi:TPA: hypothetical protein N0F65_011401 [Lagenidium giganteum]|uniref:Ion transport domain-containing protein n=1 Tax=Lagenidium giganteum TaxID=4803 RepID=A0AAV2ZGX1_9STRA|nr:TPA: hypothetical protein N0F65_011401 [Lagenidium giganteum]